jgi:hypothetical protein
MLDELHQPSVVESVVDIPNLKLILNHLTVKELDDL